MSFAWRSYKTYETEIIGDSFIRVMGCFQSRVKPRPFGQLRQFIRDQKEQRRERKRLKELKRLNVLTGSDPRNSSPTPSRVVSTHSSLASTSLDIAKQGSMQSLSDSSGSSDSFSSLDVFEQETGNVLDGDDDKEEDDVHPLAPAMTVTTLSDADNNDENGVRTLSMWKSRSDQIEVANRATAAAAARQRALNRATVSITATGIRNRLPTIPENEIPCYDGPAPLPLPQPRPTQASARMRPDDFCLPGFIP